MGFDHSLHDAWIESVTIGPRREIRLSLGLGSARLSDPRLPDTATFRLGAIANYEQVSAFFTRFEPKLIARIDRVSVFSKGSQSCIVALQIDPQGTIEVLCSKVEFLSDVT